MRLIAWLAGLLLFLTVVWGPHFLMAQSGSCRLVGARITSTGQVVILPLSYEPRIEPGTVVALRIDRDARGTWR